MTSIIICTIFEQYILYSLLFRTSLYCVTTRESLDVALPQQNHVTLRYHNKIMWRCVTTIESCDVALSQQNHVTLRYHNRIMWRCVTTIESCDVALSQQNHVTLHYHKKIMWRCVTTTESCNVVLPQQNHVTLRYHNRIMWPKHCEKIIYCYSNAWLISPGFPWVSRLMSILWSNLDVHLIICYIFSSLAPLVHMNKRENTLAAFHNEFWLVELPNPKKQKFNFWGVQLSLLILLSCFLFSGKDSRRQQNRDYHLILCMVYKEMGITVLYCAWYTKK